MSEKSVIALSKVKAGKRAKLVGVDAGQGLKHRLAAMGLLPDTHIKVVRNEGRGQLIVNVKGTKVVLGRGMSDKVMVVLLK